MTQFTYQIISHNPEVHATLTEALALHQQHQFHAAQLLYERVLSDDPEQPDALVLTGALALQREQYEAAATILAKAVTAHEECALAWTYLAIALKQLDRAPQALTCVEHALTLDAQNALAQNTKGDLLRQAQRVSEALTCFDRACELDPEYADAWNNRGVVLREIGQLQESAHALQNAVRLAPASAAAHTNFGNTLRDMGLLNDAMAEYQCALQHDSAFAGARWNMAMLQLLMGDFTAGWVNFESRWQNPGFTSPARTFSRPLWVGEPILQGKTILIHSEQGFGDTLQFCRYIPRLAEQGATVLLEAEAALLPLLASLPGVSACIAKGAALPPFDLHCPLMSLPLACSTTADAIPAEVPYLRAPVTTVEAWRQRLGNKTRPRVGLTWSGNPAHENDRNRSLALATLLQALQPCLNEIELISLQQTVRPTDAAMFAMAQQQGHLLHFGDALRDFADTAAVIEGLDLVITVDTAVAHLAGALGKPVWVLLPYLPDWRWQLGREDSPWYPTMRLLRQEQPGDWTQALQTLTQALATVYPADSTAPTSTLTDMTRWSNTESLQESWDARAEVAAQFIADGAVVLDIGCGKMALERYLPKHCTYHPCDVVARDTRTEVCDLNNREFPYDTAQDADVITLLGVIEYIVDLPAFFQDLRDTNCEVVVTYHTTNMTVNLDRSALGWLNHLSTTDIAQLFLNAGFSVSQIERLSDIQLLFKLTPVKSPQLTRKKVAVLSYANVGNFGDRLGVHLLHSVLPANAQVDHFYFKPWTVPADLSGYDLLVLGIGNSLFAPLMTDALDNALDQVPHAIGIFGTQYRDAIDEPRLQRILDRLDRWYARHAEDVLLYGRNRQNVVHFGDWLIDAFPMAQAHDDTPLHIGDEIWNDLPLDRTIQQIQQHKTVTSTRLHPLLCALTSADVVQYCEQRESGTPAVSGKFCSMLIDIFGRTYPENTAWVVDKNKVMNYKKRVSDNVAVLRTDLAYLLNGS